MDRFRFAYAALAALTLAACGSPEAGEAVPERARSGAAPAPAPQAVPAPAAEQPSAAPVADDPQGGAPTPAQEPSGEAPPAAPRPASSTPAPPRADPRAEPADQEPSNEAAEILRRAERAYESVRSLQAGFVQEVTVPLLDSTQRSRGTIYHRRPDRFLMKFSDPAGDVVVADGRYLWMYYPSADAKQVLRSDLASGTERVDLQQQLLRDATERYTAAVAGTEAVGGRPADVLVLTPRGASPYRSVKVWVDREDHLVRRFEVTEENGSVRKLELRDLRTNVTLSDDLFSFAPPPGTQVFHQ